MGTKRVFVAEPSLIGRRSLLSLGLARVLMDQRPTGRAQTRGVPGDGGVSCRVAVARKLGVVFQVLGCRFAKGETSNDTMLAFPNTRPSLTQGGSTRVRRIPNDDTALAWGSSSVA